MKDVLIKTQMSFYNIIFAINIIKKYIKIINNILGDKTWKY